METNLMHLITRLAAQVTVLDVLIDELARAVITGQPHDALLLSALRDWKHTPEIANRLKSWTAKDK